MGRLKKSQGRSTFDYSKNRKKLKLKAKKRDAPRIDCPQIRNAWDNKKSVKQNFKEMGLAFGSKTVLPIHNTKNDAPPAQGSVKKPHVIRDLEVEASLPTISKTTCSTDLIEYVQHMVKEHNDNYKAMARDEKNYYQDTPKQIKRKVDFYKRCHPEDYATFMASLKA